VKNPRKKALLTSVFSRGKNLKLRRQEKKKKKRGELAGRETPARFLLKGWKALLRTRFRFIEKKGEKGKKRKKKGIVQAWARGSKGGCVNVLVRFLTLRGEVA